MRRITLAIGIVAFVLLQIALLHMDYELTITDHYDIANNPHNNAWNGLWHVTKGLVLSDVLEYNKLAPGIVCGRSNEGFFIAGGLLPKI